jgi:hypothetical protein
MEPVKITNTTYYSPADTTFGFFIDGEFLYFCNSEILAKEFLIDLTKNLETKFKKSHPDHRVVTEQPNSWKMILSKVRDGRLLAGKPTVIHVIEIKSCHKLLKVEQEQEKDE